VSFQNFALFVTNNTPSRYNFENHNYPIYMGHYRLRNRAIITRRKWDVLDDCIKDRYIADLEKKFGWYKQVGEKIGMNAAEAASAGKICWYAYYLEIMHYNVGYLNMALGATQRLMQEIKDDDHMST
jgi:hypothetical protein